MRFYNLNWGAPIYFHPDERNIASSVTGLHFPNQLNPKFFAYGSLPIYTIYTLGVVKNFLVSYFSESSSVNLSVSFEDAILISRAISAFFSTLVIFLVILLLQKKVRITYALLGGALTSLNVGMLQYAHFGTFEMWLTLFFVLLLFPLLNYIKTKSVFSLCLISFIAGLLITIKISSLFVIPLIFVIILFKQIFHHTLQKSKIELLKRISAEFLFVIFLSSLTVLFTYPYLFLDIQSFLNSMNYESAVGLGTLEVFYTGGFTNTTPVIFQFSQVYPFLLNPILLITFLSILPITIFLVIKNKNKFLFITLILLTTIFLTQTFLYVKWMRYYVPTLPFVIILVVYSIKFLADKLQGSIRFIIVPLIIVIAITSSLLYSLSYFYVVLNQKHATIQAAQFAEKNIPPDSKIISEVYDLGIIPFNERFSNIILFDFYALDNASFYQEKHKELEKLISQSDYLILPSQRILRNRALHSDQFPHGNEFYKTLDNNFELIYQTPCSVFCKILYMGDPVFALEETANVFDRPTVMIYKIHE